MAGMRVRKERSVRFGPKGGWPQSLGMQSSLEGLGLKPNGGFPPESAAKMNDSTAWPPSCPRAVGPRAHLLLEPVGKKER